VSRQMRVYSREFRMQVVRRIRDGEKVPALSEELGIHRKLLYEWMRRVNEGGESNLRERGRPRKIDSAEGAADSAPRRIAELERTVAHQQLVIEFFRHAFQRVVKVHPQRSNWRDRIFQTIEAMLQRQVGLSVETMCKLARVGRSGYYRYLRTRGAEASTKRIR
jgi:transposase-like protein